MIIINKIKFLTILLIAFLISGCTDNSQPSNNQPMSYQDGSLSAPVEGIIREEKQNINQQSAQGGEMIQQKDALGPPEMQIDASQTYKAVLSTTEGVITINLYADVTPITVNNFVYLSQKGFYNQTIFHRVIKGFMIQGGDPNGDGTGGPGYKFNDEPIEGEYKKGIVAMANSGPNTNGSQFFIMHQDNPLPKNYVIFGQVIEGMETVDKIAEAPAVDNGVGENSKPVNPVMVESVQILEE